ncbi:MAG TPA: hypothetical protein VKR59_16825 [Terriglobales bacterium]|nr:hypothetical protein [Terriglobales bacterium]
MTLSASSTTLDKLQALFLCSLFLYPFSAAGHTLYMIPQVLLLALGLVLLPQSAAATDVSIKVGVFALAIVTSFTAIFREVVAEQPDFLEPAKLFINLSTVLLLLFLAPVFDPLTCAKWLKRFGMIWLVVVIAAYVYAHTSTWEMLLLLLQPEGLTSTRLYEIAEPLAPIFLTKNIVAMYIVAVFGGFLYFRRSSGKSVTLAEKTAFTLLVVLLFSRQAILSLALLLSLDYFLGRKKKMQWSAVAVIAVTALVVGSFLALAFDFSSPEDGAATRLDLWRTFFTHWTHYGFTGLGVHQLNASLDHLDIDNYHMFFMNQIAAYGIIHTVAFNLLTTFIALWSLPKKICWLLIAPYWLNVAFQTYGYEYGNLFLFCIAANSCNLNLNQTTQLSFSHGVPAPSSIQAF